MKIISLRELACPSVDLKFDHTPSDTEQAMTALLSVIRMFVGDLTAAADDDDDDDDSDVSDEVTTVMGRHTMTALAVGISIPYFITREVADVELIDPHDSVSYLAAALWADLGDLVPVLVTLNSAGWLVLPSSWTINLIDNGPNDKPWRRKPFKPKPPPQPAPPQPVAG